MKAAISIFIPHAGCPNDCIFCDQKRISGQTDLPSSDDIKKAVETASNSKNFEPQNTELAFFGGSFTALEKDLMLFHLIIGFQLCKKYGLAGIRISTRPDCIDLDILNTLKQYGVTTIELGVQSLDDNVLNSAKRGHIAQDSIMSAKLIKQEDFNLILQMMIGLPLQTEQSIIDTANGIIALKPDGVRIYPLLVLKDTELYELYEKGQYTPLTLEKAIEISKQLLILFKEYNIPVIKLGLHSEEGLTDTDKAIGPYHPAFRELVESEIFYDKAKVLIEKQQPTNKNVIIKVNPADISKMTGQRKSNITKLCKVLSLNSIKVIPDSKISKDNLQIAMQ